jgi:alginate O-acetyltransferase complex protein AlgJ
MDEALSTETTTLAPPFSPARGSASPPDGLDRSPFTSDSDSQIDAFSIYAWRNAAAERNRGRTLSLLFCGLICLPLAGFLTGWADPSVERTQRRTAAPFPELKVRWRGPIPVPRSASLAEWPSGFEAWFNDRWGFRRVAQQGYSSARVAGVVPGVLDLPRAAENGVTGGATVVVGSDGWLFYGGQNALDSYRATDLFTADELAAWKRAFAERRDWLAERGIPYVVMFAPDKSTIYPEHLPRSVSRVGSTTRLDQLLETLRNVEGLTVVDPRAALLRGKQEGLVYSATDSHWNESGALIALRELCAATGPLLPGSSSAEFVPPLVSKVDRWSGEARGDLVGLLDMPIPPVEEHVRVQFTREPQLTHLMDGRDERQVRWTLNRRTAPLSRAVVIHDSFFFPLIPAFGDRFERVAYASYRDFSPELIESERPQIVVQQIVERSLLTLKPENVSLAEYGANVAKHASAK